MIGPLSLPTPAVPKPGVDAVLMQKAKALEATFLTELLGYSGLGKTESSFDGGIGENQFASFLREEQAKLMVERGGIGLAKLIFESLKTQEETANGGT